MLRFALIAALLAAGLAYGKHDRTLERAGLLGSCAHVAGALPDGGEWQACRSGRLTGYPDLSRDGCVALSEVGELRYWRCPASLVGSRDTRA